MLESSRLQIDRIKVTEELNSIEVRSDDPEHEQRSAERRVLEARLNALNQKLITAFEKEDQDAQVALAVRVDMPGDAWTPELREFRDLGQKVSLADYMNAAIDGKPVHGAAGEYNQQVFGRNATGDFPIEMLLDREEVLKMDATGHLEIVEAEKRTTITGTGINPGASASFVQRLFGSGEGGFMNASYPAVGPGDHSYPIVSGSTIASDFARGGSETAAGGITINTATNRRIQHSYEIAGEDENRIPSIANSLTGDLRMSLMAGLDNYVVDQLVGQLTITPGKNAVVESLALFMSRIGAVVDGKGARNIGDVRALLGTRGSGVTPFSLLAGISLASGGSHFAELWNLSNPAFVRGSAHLVEVGGAGFDTGDGPVLFAKTGSNVRRLIVPVWRRGTLLRDTGRLQLDGVVTYTAAMFAAVELAATDMHRLGSIHTA